LRVNPNSLMKPLVVVVVHARIRPPPTPPRVALAAAGVAAAEALQQAVQAADQREASLRAALAAAGEAGESKHAAEAEARDKVVTLERELELSIGREQEI